MKKLVRASCQRQPIGKITNKINVLSNITHEIKNSKNSQCTNCRNHLISSQSGHKQTYSCISTYQQKDSKYPGQSKRKIKVFHNTCAIYKIGKQDSNQNQCIYQHRYIFTQNNLYIGDRRRIQ